MKNIFAILAILVSLVLGFLIGRDCNSEPTIVYKEKTDTLYIEKTKIDSVPKEVAKIVIKTEYIPVTDTAYVHDSIYIKIPIEQKTYETEDYKAIVSGYKPSLDYMEVRCKEVQITHEIAKKDKWGLGVSVGYGFGKQISPYIGVSVNYNLLTW